jgi:hypothetical protein
MHQMDYTDRLIQPEEITVVRRLTNGANYSKMKLMRWQYQ